MSWGTKKNRGYSVKQLWESKEVYGKGLHKKILKEEYDEVEEESPEEEEGENLEGMDEVDDALIEKNVKQITDFLMNLDQSTARKIAASIALGRNVKSKDTGKMVNAAVILIDSLGKEAP